MSDKAWQDVAARFPWPSRRPKRHGLATEGWLHNLTKGMLASTFGGGIIVELGTWLGLSARFLLDGRRDRRMVCIDTWLGSEEHVLRPNWAACVPLLWEEFLSVNWEYQDRLIPVRMASVTGMRVLHKLGLRPSGIYIDAAHDYDSVVADVSCVAKLFPEAQVVGDDWSEPQVREAVTWVASQQNWTIEDNGQAWRKL